MVRCLLNRAQVQAMEKRQSGWSLRWVAVALALAGAACSGEQLGGGPHGSGGDGVGPCPSCPVPGPVGTTGAGGSKGSGGTGGNAMDAGTVLCEQIAAKYQTALSVASACTPGAANQCQVLVGDVPANCPDSGTQSYVNDGSLVESERDNWLYAGCGGLPQPCIGIGGTPPPGVCAAVPGSASGVCVPPDPTDGGAGPSPDAGETCDQLAADYSAALSAAATCTPGAPNQCQALVDPALEPCDTGCRPPEPVNDATAVNAAWMRWVAQCATGGCPAILCEPPPAPTGICVLAGNGTGTGTAWPQRPGRRTEASRAPEVSRTPNPRLRRPMLYPVELRAQKLRPDVADAHPGRQGCAGAAGGFSLCFGLGRNVGWSDWKIFSFAR